MNRKQIINPLPQGTLLHGKAYNYVIEATLGQGSFGITYVAVAKVQMQGALGMLESNMKVAIKEFFMKEVNGREGSLVTASSTNGIYVDYKKKFRAEAEHLAKLEHPNIINVLELFEANNTCYYVMEYIDGGSLNDYIRSRGPLPEHDLCENIRQIGDALSYMHSHKMLHLDLKPANIMRKADGTLVLIDFGLSKQFDENGVPETDTTIGGGTPGYAPLQQANYSRGDGFPVTMDVYALGATAYAMATGKNPPEASCILDQGFPRKAFANLPVSQAIVSVIEKAMAPTVANRYPSVDSMLASLSGGGNAAPSAEPVIEDIDTASDTIIRGKKENIDTPSPGKTDETSKEKGSNGYVRNIIMAIVAIACFAGGVCVKNCENTNEPVIEAPDTSRDTIDTIPITTETPPDTIDATPNTVDGHEWVDLGLPSGTKWATTNVGASSPSDYGNYYAWGETSTKSSYTWKNLKYCLDTTGDKFSKYVTNKKFGKVDGKKELDPSDDAAYVNWGSSWRMPSNTQQDELREKCKWTWTTMGGHKGYKVVGPNGNSLFVPAAGVRYDSGLYYVGSDGYYWSRSLCLDGQWVAYKLYFNSGGVSTSYGLRSYGRSVRAVLGL